jgi:hypothetical protein
MYIELRVVVQRRHRRRHVAGQIEVVLAGIAPPRGERPLVVVGAVSVVVKPQTEAGSGQSKRPDLGVLSMTPDRCGQPLLAEVFGDL